MHPEQPPQRVGVSLWGSPNLHAHSESTVFGLWTPAKPQTSLFPSLASPVPALGPLSETHLLAQLKQRAPAAHLISQGSSFGPDPKWTLLAGPKHHGRPARSHKSWGFSPRNTVYLCAHTPRPTKTQAAQGSWGREAPSQSPGGDLPSPRLSCGFVSRSPPPCPPSKLSLTLLPREEWGALTEPAGGP